MPFANMNNAEIEQAGFAADSQTAAGCGRQPWLRWYGDIPATIKYPDGSLYEAIALSARRAPKNVAWDFFGTTATYKQFLKSIDACAGALASIGVKAGDNLLILLPTTPQAIILFYATNKLGAVAALLHPLSTAPEIEHCLDATQARVAITLDMLYDTLVKASPALPLKTIILTRLSDYLPCWACFSLALKGVHPSVKLPLGDSRVCWWRSLMKKPPVAPTCQTHGDQPAAIMFSAGTTGTAKGVVLSNRNLLAQGMQAASWLNFQGMHSVLAAMPIFHGFGLGLCINAAFLIGGLSILVPLPEQKIVADLIRKRRPNILLGVPSFFNSLLHNKDLQRADLSCLQAVFAGGDMLPTSLKAQFDEFIARQGSKATLMQGYGLTESVSAAIAMPPSMPRENSIGIPFPDTRAKICQVGTDAELPPGQEGEICIAGPAVMLGYLNDPQATQKAVHKLADGMVWLHTGDLGTMDKDGFFYFKERLKRVIKSSGFNVFPSQVEAVLTAHPFIKQACVVGITDSTQGQRVIAHVVLKDAKQATVETATDIIDYCHARLIKWSCPREVKFLAEIPLTRLGKIDYQALSKS